MVLRFVGYQTAKTRVPGKFWTARNAQKKLGAFSYFSAHFSAKKQNSKSFGVFSGAFFGAFLTFPQPPPKKSASSRASFWEQFLKTTRTKTRGDAAKIANFLRV